jgi:hypothetical protein
MDTMTIGEILNNIPDLPVEPFGKALLIGICVFIGWVFSKVF